MSLIQEVELLRAIPLFAGIEPSKLKLLAFASERLTYEPGVELFKQGDIGDAAYVIMEGEVDVIIDTARGPFAMARLGRNSLVGEIAILRDVRRTATVKASSRVVALRIAKDLFFRLVNEFPQMGVAVMRDLAKRVEEANKKAQELAASGAP
jgi:CRP/FNR family transcriptional regulator, cyclic AMP receptor protein